MYTSHILVIFFFSYYIFGHLITLTYRKLTDTATTQHQIP